MARERARSHLRPAATSDEAETLQAGPWRSSGQPTGAREPASLAASFSGQEGQGVPRPHPVRA